MSADRGRDRAAQLEDDPGARVGTPIPTPYDVDTLRHDVRVSRTATGRLVTAAVVALGVLIGLGHILFGLANFQPGFPRLEGVAAIAAGLAILASLAVARRSMYRALVTACLGSLPLVAWFAYAVPIERSSDPIFFCASLVLPTVTGLAALLLRRSRRHEQ